MAQNVSLIQLLRLLGSALADPPMEAQYEEAWILIALDFCLDVYSAVSQILVLLSLIWDV
jgi:hypothetical protein